MGWLPGPQLAELHGGEWAYLFLHHPRQEGALLGGGGGVGGGVLAPGTSLVPPEEWLFLCHLSDAA